MLIAASSEVTSLCIHLVFVTLWLAKFNPDLTHSRSDIWMDILHIVRIHVIPDHALKQMPCKLNAMLAVGNVRLYEGPHLGEQLASCSPTHNESSLSVIKCMSVFKT
jgi:hypothetical protein